ncbi:hypothetical protein C7H19_11305 [Aphanothece hegewaldii CCALA 016]|uniref:DUF3352 domain-containing protein n=1 Tax=Aphanothece hegewaldii CCALA 016 TaxID=2107694 RepID=A0A2T1LY32_9CHRO|nr:DUF3352 domain-containing protein [Aphanothece hegewaldii]PSF37297.1 hypothetical protein C7H19_11305 [Aphanothece hegewaldii CCALA 016]
MSRQKSGCGFLSIFGFLTLATAGGAYVYFNGFPSALSFSLPWEQFTPVEAAKVIPDEAIVTTYINTDPQTWSKLTHFGTPEAQKLVRHSLDEFTSQSSPSDINYSQDIQPWIEDIAIAVLPSVQNEAQILFVMGIRDKLKAANFAKKLKDQPNQTFTETKYQGFTIIERTSPNSELSYSAIVGKYLLYSDNRSVIELAINTKKGEPSYRNKPQVKELLSQSGTLKNPLIQTYIDDYDQLVNQSAASLPPDSQIPVNTLKNITSLNSVVLLLGVEETGIHLQAMAHLNPTETPTPNNIQPSSSQLLSYLPSETLMFMNGQGIKQGWINLVKESNTDSTIQSLVKQIRDNFKMANLNADQDVFGWMDQEFALGLVASNQPTLGNLGIGGVLVLQTSDRATAENTFDKLKQLSIFLPQMEVNTTDIDGKNITEWKSKFNQEVFLSYGWLDNQAIAMTVAMPFQTVLQSQSSNSLSQSQNFKEITASLPEKNFGYFYLDLERSFHKALTSSNGIESLINPESRAVLDSIKGIAITSTMPTQAISQVDMILSLKSTHDVLEQK